MGVWKERGQLLGHLFLMIDFVSSGKGHNKNASEWTVESVPTSATDARISTIGT